MIYLDHHATTPCDPRVVEAMLPWLTEHFGNPHSVSHAAGIEAATAMGRALEEIAELLDTPADTVLVTSGATESNNLALLGVLTHPRQKRRHLITAQSEHPAILDVCDELEREGFEVTRLPVDRFGLVELDQLADALRDDTALVSLMWANNEIGSIAPMSQIAELCHARGALLHSDATQAVGRLDLSVRGADVDLVSASAHKFYGPKGVGLLVAGNGNRRVRLRPQIVGGGQQRGLRSGTMNPAGVIAMATALRLAARERPEEATRLRGLREAFFGRLREAIGDLSLNGFELASEHRLPGNLNFTLPAIEGSAWMAATPEVAFSSGSACSSAEELPSHVLRAIGRSESEARRSVRFGLGRFNVAEEIEGAAESLIASYRRVARLG